MVCTNRPFCPTILIAAQLAQLTRFVPRKVFMKVLRKLPLSAALALALAAPAQAQSLVELFESARSYDAAYQAAKAQYAANKSKADQALALVLPTVGLTASSARA